MKYIKKEKLIEGEIYKSTLHNHIFKYVDKDGNQNPTISVEYSKFNKNYATVGNGLDNIINATPEEKHWLNSCIEADKFITFEEVMKTFIPEYVECIIEQPQYYNYGKLRVIYKVENWNYSINDCWLEGTTSASTSKNRFKPSTKEAYNAQFVVKEIVKPLPQFKVIESIETITKVENNEGNQFFIGDVVRSDAYIIHNIKSFKYNVDNTGILAITNKLTLGININYIEHYIEPKTDYEILEYKTEGGISCKAPFLQDSHQFYINERCKIYSIKRISDNLIITVGDDVLSKTCGVPNKILSIELINNKIRLYPRNSFYNLEDILNKEIKNETLLEKAKRLYPVGTRFKCLITKTDYIISENITFRLGVNNKNKVYSYVNNLIFHQHYNGQIWAEIIK